MESTRKARSRIKPSVFPRERSLRIPYKTICTFMYFPRGWEKTAMSSKAATLAGDSGVLHSPDFCSA